MGGPQRKVSAEVLRLVVYGALTDTLSKVAVATAVALPLFTTKPTYTVCAMLIAWLANCAQFTPSIQ